MKILRSGILALGLTVLGNTAVMAQSNNSPIAFGVGGGNAGISLGHRQAILNSKLLGQRPNALVRGPSGGLLEIDRRGRNAFVRIPGDGAFLPGVRPNQGWGTGLGTGLGWNLISFSTGGVIRNQSAQSLNSWISLVPSDPEGQAIGYYGTGNDSTPIDAWIMQLDHI